MATERMFQVLVLGGIALLGGAAPVACGGDVATASDAGSSGDSAGVYDANDESFPSELPTFVDSGPYPDASNADVYFPSETAQAIDASADVGADGAGDATVDGFPVEA
jgi:hypothetical protein